MKSQAQSKDSKLSPGDLVIGVFQEIDGVKYEPIKPGFVWATIGDRVVVFVDGEFYTYPGFFLKKL